MQNFVYSIPTTVYFGKGQIENLPKAIKAYGSKVLMVYGGGSIKKSGLYDTIMGLCKDNGISVVELSGVDPNPRVESVNEGVRLCRENGVEVVLGVGGGSSLDCAKTIAACVDCDCDAWDVVTKKVVPEKILPVVTVLTLAATGSEMDTFAVISNMKEGEKLGVGYPDMRPKASIMDPTYTFSVSKYQTASGTADIMSHLMETYFTMDGDTAVQDGIIEGLLKVCIKYGPIALAKPDDYDARANLMWAGSLAINDLTRWGKATTWSCHSMEHQLSAYYDVTHGVGLAILTPAWMEHILSDKTLPKFVDFGVNVWGIDKNLDAYEIAHKAIDMLRDFFTNTMGIAKDLPEIGIKDEENFDIMAEKAAKGLKTAFVPLSKEDVIAIYRACK